MSDQGPKIIVDSDWKSQAQAEKERLAAAEKAKQPATPAGPAGTSDPEGPPQPTMEELIKSLAMQALMYLGAFPDPETGRRMVGLEPAKFNIDLLSVLEQKTKGNLTTEESQLLTQMLHELRMQYVEISAAVAKAVEQGRVQPGGGPGTAPAIPPVNFMPRA